MSLAPAIAAAPSYVIQGRDVRLPVLVRDASSGAATYAVSSAAARRLLPGDALEPVEIWPGRALCSLAVIDYRDNDLGNYHEFSIAFFVRQRGAAGGLPYLGTIADFLRGRVATYIRHLPVDQGFTCEAGRTIWGFPKTMQRIEIATDDRRAHCTLEMDGQHVLTLALPRGGGRQLPEAAMTTYSFIDGVAHRTRFTSSGAGAGFHLGGAELRLGAHPIAAELRSLGLPKRALMTMWIERMHASFDAAVPL